MPRILNHSFFALFRINNNMLYSDFKKSFDNQKGAFNDTYTVEDARNFKKQNQEQPKAKRKKSVKRAFGIIICMILIVSCAFLLYAEVFIDGGIKGFFSSLKTKDSREAYYYVFVTAQDYDDAKAISDNLRLKGGAGYVYFDGEYKVILSLYDTESEAISVSEKNASEYFETYSSEIYKSFPLKVKSSAEKCVEAKRDLIKALAETSAALQKNSDIDVKERLNKEYNAYLEGVSDFLDKTVTLEDASVLAYRSKILSTKRILESLTKTQTRASYLADVRFALVAISLL